ncbi:protein kinase [Mycobacterium sp. 1423905.2]|nr:protein kinase [Mycobacterium sp. 1423905.2]
MFGPYLLKRPLGRGGMGEVYEAEHTGKGWTVAVKLLSREFSNDPVFRERMKREARITGRLQEPHVVPIHDYGEIDGQLFLEMRLVEGTDLDAMLKQSGPLAPPRAVAILSQVASALDAAHAAGVTHRDIKPPNILVTRDDFAYLVDFGIASATADERLTQLGTAVGTWKYMAPERFTNDKVTFRADIYSLACVLYECLTGSPPYSSESAGVLISAHMMEPIPRPSGARSGIPGALDEVVARGMAKRPADRYASAGELTRAAHAALSAPDQNRAATILRRSQEAVLPAPPAEPATLQHPRPPQPAPLRYPAAPPGPPAPPPAPMALPPQHFAGPPAWNPGLPPGLPQSSPRPRNPWLIVTVVAALVLVLILGAIGIWAATKDGGDDNASGRRSTSTTTRTSTRTTTTTTSPPTSTGSAAQARLLSLVPSGYPAGSCTPDSRPMPGALVSVSCGQNTEVNGPRVSAYGLYSDVAALKKAFTSFTGTFTLAGCPGGKASPGTWWHTQDPNTVLGQLACGNYKGDEPQVMWSNEQTLVYALVAGSPQGPTLDQLYKWWAKHS